jgi:hypothetical protein
MELYICVCEKSSSGEKKSINIGENDSEITKSK